MSQPKWMLFLRCGAEPFGDGEKWVIEGPVPRVGENLTYGGKKAVVDQVVHRVESGLGLGSGGYELKTRIEVHSIRVRDW